MSSVSDAQSYREVIAFYQDQYHAAIADGSAIPFTYPMASYGIAIGLLFLLIPPTYPLPSSLTRYATFLAILYWHVFLIGNCRALNVATGFGIGCLASWGVLWSAVIFVFRDAKAEDMRIQGLAVDKIPKLLPERHMPDHKGGHSKKPILSNGFIDQSKMSDPIWGSVATPSSEHHADDKDVSKAQGQHMRVFWEPYPTLAPLIRRLDWAVDLYTNFRGMGWTFQLSCVPPLPAAVRTALNSQVATQSTNSLSPEDLTDPIVSRNGLRRCDDFWSCLIHHAWVFLKGYLAIDLLKVITHHDPYFWGLVARPPPTYFPFSLVSKYWLLTHTYRLVCGMSLVWLGLRCVFSLGPLIFLGLLTPLASGRSPLPPAVKKQLASAARTEPWLYPDHYGSVMLVLDRGIAGWWGGWWHQIFRHAFQSAADFVTRKSGLAPRTLPANVVGLFVVFGLSGIIHASGSYTQQGGTRPVRGPLAFFLLQACGIILEMRVARFILHPTTHGNAPRGLVRMVNFLWVYSWFMLTGPLLVNDLSKGGLFLLQPPMISPLRGLGFGVPGDGWFCGFGKLAEWHWDRERWWLSGFAF